MSLGDIFNLSGALVGGGSGGNAVPTGLQNISSATAQSLGVAGPYADSYDRHMQEMEFRRQQMMAQVATQTQSQINLADHTVSSADMVDAPSALDMSLADLVVLWRQRFGENQWVPLKDARADGFWRIVTTRLINATLLERLEVIGAHPEHSRVYRLRSADGDR